MLLPSVWASWVSTMKTSSSSGSNSSLGGGGGGGRSTAASCGSTSSLGGGGAGGGATSPTGSTVATKYLRSAAGGGEDGGRGRRRPLPLPGAEGGEGGRAEGGGAEARGAEVGERRRPLFLPASCDGLTTGGGGGGGVGTALKAATAAPLTASPVQVPVGRLLVAAFTVSGKYGVSMTVSIRMFSSPWQCGHS
jgi:hypothetical protein